MSQFLAVVFDLDGTLLDSLEDLADAANEVLQSFGFPEHPYDAYRRAIGDGVATLFARIVPPGSETPELIAECIRRMSVAHQRNWQAKTRPYDGIETLLQQLTAAGYVLTILSNKPQASTARCAAAFFPDVPFRLVFGQRDGVPRKPDPAGALEIARELSVPPARCLYLGDTSIDMHTACAAGMYPVGAAWGFRTRDELLSSGARQLAEHPRDVWQIVQGAPLA